MLVGLLKTAVPNPYDWSARYARTRRDHAAETAQDYVEAIQQIYGDGERCRSRDLARRFEVSPVTVLKVLRRLERDGLVELEPYGPIRLTDRGAKLAQECRRRHEAVYAFLVALGISKRTAEIDAEGIEHHVSKETLRAMRRFTKSRESGG